MMTSGRQGADNANRIFSSDDIERAERWLDVTAQRPIINAVRFRNALHAFLRGVDNVQGVTSPLKIMAVDASEVVALTDYNVPSYRNFTFDKLLDNVPSHNSRMQALDRLINQHLLAGRQEPFLLMPSHADEVVIMQQAVSLRVQEQKKTLDQSAFGKISSSQRSAIKKWFEGLEDRSLEDNWQQFKKNFLDDISDKFLESLIKGTKAASSFDAFIKNAKYMFLRPPSAGARSLATHIQQTHPWAFDWAAYDDYRNKPEVLDRGREIVTVLTDLLLRVRRGNRSIDVIQDAAKRDAQAIALIDLLNRFFLNGKSGVRIDLVSRSPSLHDLMSSLPEGALHLTLRHPLFLPDIYAFDLNQLNRLGEALLRVDATLASAIDIESLSNSTAAGSESDLIEEVRRCALDVVDVLDGALTVRQALESASFDGATGDQALSQLIKDFFQRVEAGNSDGRDLFSSNLLTQLAQRNKTLAEFARPRVFSGSSRTIPLRLIDFFQIEEKFSEDTAVLRHEKKNKGDVRPPRPIKGLMPDVLMMVRADLGEFRRVFFIHSGRVARLIRRSNRPDVGDGTGVPQIAHLSVDQMFSQLSSALDALIKPKAEGACADDDAVFNLDATLIVCIAFASCGRYDTAIALASTMLHKVTSELRYGGGEPQSIERMRERLAYRELFLCRHYCERALARHDFFSQERRLADSKGSVAKNLARAQRDLDFATLMAEQVEQAAGEASPSPAGNQIVQDGRLRLAHLGGWIDQLVMILHAESTWESKENRTDPRLHLHQKRFDIFTAAGLIKETALVAWTVRKKREALTQAEPHAENLKRYYAYIEVSGLQSALLIFCVFMAYPLSSPLHRLWLGDTSIEPERILVFRDWERWYKQYRMLDEQFGFAMRPRKLMETVCTTLAEAARLPAGPKGAPGRGSVRKPELLVNLLLSCVEDLKRLSKSKPLSDPMEGITGASDSYGLISTLSRALADRIMFIVQHDALLVRHLPGGKQSADD